MLERLRSLRRGAPEPHDDQPESAPVFTGLRLFSAELLLLTGVNATLHYLRPRSAMRPRTQSFAATKGPDQRRPTRAGAWAPLLLGSLGCAAQTTLALRPSDRALLATRVLNGLALGIGAAGAAQDIRASIQGKAPHSVAPFLFGYAGLLGFVVDRRESMVAEEEAQLSRRTRLIDRLIPERRTKIERIVVHV